MKLNLQDGYLDSIDVESMFKSYLSFKFKQLLNQKKNYCVKNNVDFDLCVEDLTFPSHCPVLGIELNYFSEVMSNNSPSLDRFDPNGGYVKGNVVVISMRANRLKMNASPDELMAIAKYSAGL
jgi:hypothetical protein